MPPVADASGASGVNGADPGGEQNGAASGSLGAERLTGASGRDVSPAVDPSVDGPRQSPVDRTVALLESLLFVADRPVTLGELAQVLERERSAVEAALEDLAATLEARGVRLQRDNGHVQMVSAPEAAEAVQRFLGLETSGTLSTAALEVLSMVAYRQPITRPEIDELRGVNSDGALRTLVARGLVEQTGRRETVGYPFEYGTTFRFLEYFGLTTLDDLPPVEDFAAAIEEADTEQTDAEQTDVEPVGVADDSAADRTDEAAPSDAVVPADESMPADGDGDSATGAQDEERT